MNHGYSEPEKHIKSMPEDYSKNYHIVWLAENFCNYENKITPETIIQEVCNIFSVSKEMLLSKNRTHEVLTPRQIAMYVARMMTTKNKTQLGKIFNRDHTSIIHTLIAVKNYLKTNDPQFKFYWTAYISESKIYQFNQ